jgi:hypothetical protein
MADDIRKPSPGSTSARANEARAILAAEIQLALGCVSVDVGVSYANIAARVSVAIDQLIQMRLEEFKYSQPAQSSGPGFFG